MSLKRKRQMAEYLLGGMTEAAAVQKYCSSKGTVSRVRARIPELLQINFETVGDTRKRVCRLKTQGLDNLLIEWIKKARAYNCIITGPIIQEVATKLATDIMDG